MVFIRNRNEKLFCDFLKGELLYLWRQIYCNRRSLAISKIVFQALTAPVLIQVIEGLDTISTSLLWNKTNLRTEA